MFRLLIVVVFAVINVLGREQFIIDGDQQQQRSITVDYENNQFLMDGKPFRYISGSFHYFRSTPETWQKKLKLMKAAGLNAVSTYVEWSLHNPKETEIRWTGMADLVRFIELAQQEGLYVLLRPGPYICAERDLGGFPYWLLRKYPNIKFRTTDTDYLYEVRKWYSILMPKMEPYFYGNGGPIILVQIENEYGTFGCDKNYLYWLKNETEKYVQDKALFYTTDGGFGNMLKCGHINGTVQTINFRAAANVASQWKQLRNFYPQGPLINSEYYTGWLTHWEENLQRVDSDLVAKSLKNMLKSGGNVNMFMFYGGTNFGFTNGANLPFAPQITSYDYDSPIDEAGDPTPKYFKIKDVISKFVEVNNTFDNYVEPKLNFGTISFNPEFYLLSKSIKSALCSKSVNSNDPLSFENLDQNAGVVIYETNLPTFKVDPSLLEVETVHDRAWAYIDKSYVGILDRQNNIFNFPVPSGLGEKLQIIVENTGRVNYGTLDTFKGLKNIRLQKSPLTNWTMTGCSLENIEDIFELISQSTSTKTKFTTKRGPVFLATDFNLQEDQILDTFLDTTGWGKGVAFLNGVNLGRYWAQVKPQKTLYVPKEYLKVGKNTLILLEYQSISKNRTMALINHPIYTN